MSRIQMTNPDGTPFYANLNAESSVRITLSEAYNLATTLREMSERTRAMVEVAYADGRIDADLFSSMHQNATDLIARADEIESAIDADKYAQWAALDAPWAFKVSGRTA